MYQVTTDSKDLVDTHRPHCGERLICCKLAFTIDLEIENQRGAGCMAVSFCSKSERSTLKRSTFKRSMLASVMAAGIIAGVSPAIAHADITPITLENGLIATAGGCQSPNIVAIFNCTRDEVLTSRAPLLLDLNPFGTSIVVLGAGLHEDGTMPPVLTERLQAALKLAQKYPFTPIITSGGVPQSGVTEASAMRNWLVANGVLPIRITEEGESRSTVENAKNTAAILAARGASGAVVVSSPNHVERALVDFRTAVAGTLPVSGVISNS